METTASVRCIYVLSPILALNRMPHLRSPECYIQSEKALPAGTTSPGSGWWAGATVSKLVSRCWRNAQRGCPEARHAPFLAIISRALPAPFPASRCHYDYIELRCRIYFATLQAAP